jgi:hypothetical protein
MISRSWLWATPLVAALAALVIVSSVGSADPPLRVPDLPLRYRRVLVPEAELDQQIRGLLPLKRTEFERRITEATLRGQAQAAILDARLDEAVFYARLEGEALAAGKAALTIASRSDQPAVLVLGSCNLALGAASWRDAATRLAQLGNLPDGRLACVVPRSDQLTFDWNLIGQRNASGELTFELELPLAPVTRLELILPVSAELAAEGGVVARDETFQGDPSLSRWIVEAGGSTRLVLRIAAAGEDARPKPQVLIREINDYQVHAAAVDLETTLELDILHQPLRQLMLVFDEPLALTQVRLGTQSLSWAPLSSAGSVRRVVVHFPEPLLGDGIEVQVSGVASWNATGKLRLPRVGVEESVWQSGEYSVAAPPSLAIEVAPQDGCWQTAFTEGAAGRPLSQWRFQSYQAGAAIDVAPLRTIPLLVEKSGLALEVQPSQVQATLIAELAAVSQPLFEIRARIPRAWIVDSIDVQPGDWLEDRTLQTQGTGPQQLGLHLRQPLGSDRPLLIILRAHRRRPTADEQLTSDAWNPIRFADVSDTRRLVELRATDPAVQIALAGDESIRRLDPQSLAPEERKLFDPLPTGQVFEVDYRANGQRVSLVPTVPRFQAQVLVRADVEPKIHRQLCRMVVQPDDSLIAALTVRFSPPPPDAIEWSIVGEDARELMATRIVPPVPSPSDATFELRLQRPRRTEFEVQARFSRPTIATQQLPLVSLPGAESQTGLVEIHTAGGLPLSIEPVGLRSTLPLDRRATHLATLRGTYQYEPDRAADLRIRVLPPGRTLPLAWIDSLRARSHVSIDGGGEHQVELVVHNSGQQELVLRMDPSAVNLQVDVQGRRLLGSLARRRTGEYVVPLPSAQRELALRLSYTTPPASTNWLPFTELPIPWPQFDEPVLLAEWQVRLAPGLALREVAANSTGAKPVFSASRPEPAIDAAWSAYDVSIPSGTLATLSIYRPTVVAAWSWAVALVVAGVILRIASPGAGWLAGLAGLLAAVACFLPGEVAPLVVGAVVGVALGGAFGLIRYDLRRWKSVDFSHAPNSTVSLPTGRLILGFAFALAGAAATAAPPTNGIVEQPWRRVVIAVDDNQQPVGEYVFLEPEFYDSLLRLSDRIATTQPDCILQTATYRPMIAATAGGRAVESIHVDLEMESLAPDARVELPFDRREVHLVEGHSLLDGRSAVAEWSAAGRLQVTVPMPGKHRLELTLSPAAAVAAEGVWCDIAIPPVNTSRVRLPAGSAAPIVANARGVPELPAGAADRTWLLGAIGRLQLRSPNPADSGAANVEAEQIVLWNVQPGSVVAAGRFRFRPVGGKLREVAIEHDSRLRVLPLAASQPVARQWTTDLPGKKLLHLALREPASAETSVEVSFAWTGASGIGDFSLPTIKVQCDKLARDWTAVALGEELTWKLPFPASPDDPAAADLVAAWGQPLPAGVAAFDLSRRPLPPLAILPVQSRVNATEHLACSFSLQSAGVRYDANLANVPSHAFQHRLSVSQGMKIVRLTARDGERPVRLQWIQAADGNVHIQLAEAPPRALQIEAEGRLVLARAGGSHAVPLIEYVGTSSESYTLSIYRLPDVRIALSADSRSWTTQPHPEVGHYHAGRGRLSEVIRRAPNRTADPPQVVLSENVSDVTGLSLTRLAPSESKWHLDLRCALEVSTGVLDVLRWELPAGATGPVEITPAVEHELSMVTGQAYASLLVRPPLAIPDKLQLTVLVPLSGSVENGPAVLLAGLRDAQKVRKLVALPRRAGDRRFDWSTSGLQAVDPSHLQLPADWLPPGYDLFETVAPRPGASPQLRSPSAVAARVLLADHQLRLRSLAFVTGTSSFDLLPGGVRQVTLAVPPGVRLLHVGIDGVPAQIAERGGGQWSLMTAGSRLPQRIEVVYSGTGSKLASVDELQVFVPRLEGVETAHTLWTVVGAAPKDPNGATAADADPAALVRLETIAQAAESLAQRTDRETPPVALRQALDACEDRFRSSMSELPPELSSPLDQRVAAAERQLLAARKQLADAGIPLADATPPASRTAVDEERTWRLVTPGTAPSIVVQAPIQTATFADQRLLAAAAAATAGLLAWWILGSRLWQAWLARHSCFGIAAIGTVWLAIGPAPWLGGLLLALAVWCAIRSPWPREANQSISTIVRHPVR